MSGELEKSAVLSIQSIAFKCMLAAFNQYTSGVSIPVVFKELINFNFSMDTSDMSTHILRAILRK